MAIDLHTLEHNERSAAMCSDTAVFFRLICEAWNASGKNMKI